MSLKGYKTVLREARDEVVIHKSRFIGHAAPVSSTEEALRFLARIREEHRDATHNCYAYIIGQNAGIMRYSDDGEPSGTAGMPIIEVMKARGVVDCAVVVTRYFGGILLGAGGLVRAYSHTCALALDAARVCQMHPTERWLFEVAYPLWDRVQHALKSLPARLVGTDFAAAVSFELDMKAADGERVRAELTRVCRWFAALDATASLLDKAEAVLTIVTHLTTALGRAVPQPLTPDDLVDGLTFLVMRMKPNRVCANIAFLLRFAPDTMMNGELGYAVTTFAVVLQALLLRGCADGKEDVDRDWVVFRRGRRRITEAEGRRLLADFMEDCVVIEEPHATCAGPTPPPEAAVAHTGSGGDGDGSGGSDDICKEWVLM